MLRPLPKACFLALAAILSGRLFSGWPGQEGQPRGGGILAKPVGSFEVQSVSIVGALLQLGREARIPLGIEYVDLEAAERPISVSLNQSTVGEALKAILKDSKGYEWRVNDGVLIISHARVPSGRKNLLDLVLREFTLPPCTVQEAGHSLWMALDYQLRPGIRGTVGNYSPGVAHDRIGPLTMRNVTARQVLNRLVSDKRNAAWIVQVPPSYLDQVPSDGLWRIVEYDDPTLQYVPQLLRQRLRQYKPPPSRRNGH